MSPAATQTIDQAEIAILDSADDLFYEHGVSAVTVADIRDRAGVSLRRIYSIFPGKADIVSGWLRHRHATWMSQFSEDVHRRLRDGAQPVDALFDSLGAWLEATDFRGCGFINTLAETGELTDEHKGLIRDHKQAVTEFLTTVSPGGDALAVLVDGAIVQAAIFHSREPVELARRAAAALAVVRESNKS